LNSPERLRWEKRCLKRILKRDLEAFGELYREFAGPLYSRILLPLTGDAWAAEDALADTFRAALEGIGQYRQKGTSIWFWLARIARNKAMDQHRSRSRTQKALVSYDSMLAPLRPDSPKPGEQLECRQENERIRSTVQEVLGKLNPRYRRVIELRFLQDQPRQVCAEQLEVKLGTLDVLVLRALRAFRKEWTRTVGFEEVES
jgi:RNA polymerase sigma-70 factor (ECF subfamily)